QEPAQRVRRVALRVDAEHRLLPDVAALAVVEEPRQRRLEREVVLADVDAVAEEAGADPQPLDVGIRLGPRAFACTLDDRRGPRALRIVPDLVRRAGAR